MTDVETLVKEMRFKYKENISLIMNYGNGVNMNKGIEKGSSRENLLKCGMSEVNITPPMGSLIPGQIFEKFAEGVLDDLYAKALVVDDGSKVIAIVGIDAVAIQKETADKIRKIIVKSTGIEAKNIMISATHTHTGGPMGMNPDKEYVSYVVKKIADAALLAYNSRKPARIGFGKGFEDSISFYRRYYMKDGSIRTNPGYLNPDIVRPAGSIDPDVTVMRIDDIEGNALGVVSNFACHLDVVGGKLLSADYPGEISNVLKKVLGNNVVSLFLTGACGNINHVNVNWDLEKGSPKDHYKKMGRILAGEILKVREKIAVHSDVKVDGGFTIFTAGVRKPGREDVDKAEIAIRSIKKDDVRYEKQKELFMAYQLLKVYEKNEIALDVPVQVLKIGDLAVSGFPCELFVEFGLEIKNKSGFKHNMINTLTNGRFGYIATKEAFEQGGYETMINESTKMVPDTGYQMVDSVLELMERLQ